MVPAGQRVLLAQLRAVAGAKDAENAALRSELDAERELRRRLELRPAELERRLSMDSTDSGTPPSGERLGVKEARRARQPGHAGKGSGIPIRARGRTRSRPQSAAAVVPGWTARSRRSRAGRRSSTWRCSGR